MLCRTHSVGVVGPDGYPIVVETDVADGPASLTIVGRIHAASRLFEGVADGLRHCKQLREDRRLMVVNIAPLGVLHDSPGLELAIVAGLLGSHGLIPAGRLDGAVFWGQIGARGQLRPVPGAQLVASVARRAGFARIVVAARGAEAAASPGLEVLAIDTLADLVAHFCGERSIEPINPERARGCRPTPAPLDDSPGPEPLSMIEVALAGGHDIVARSSMRERGIADAIAKLLPRLEPEAAREVGLIHDLAGLPRSGADTRAPVRRLTPKLGLARVLGQQDPPRPGELALAHHGALIAAGIDRWSGSRVRQIRAALTDGKVWAGAGDCRVCYPSRFWLFATARGDAPRWLVDRGGMVIEGEAHALLAQIGDMDRARKRIARARTRQALRLVHTPWQQNAEIPAGPATARLCPMTDEAQARFDGWSRGRGAPDPLRRLARTVADLLDPAGDPHAPVPLRAIVGLEGLPGLDLRT